MKICKVLTTMMFLMVLANSVQAQRRTIAVSQHKDPPIEVVSIELDKQTLLPDVKFNAPDGWTENLRIKVKNVSEEPITRIEMILGIFSLTDPDVAALTAHYSFGKIRVESLAPNDTVVLTHTGTKGDNNVPGAARLSITSVIWNGDDSLKYDGGRILRKEPGREGQPPIYHRIDPPQAKYHYPKGFRPRSSRPLPLIFNRLHEKIQLTDTEHGVVFDGNQWAWTEPGSPNSFLVRDIDKNGSIDSLRELFSNISPQSPSFAPNGFRALADLDSNSDGGVDSRDRLYSELQWWTDLNHDGISQSTELDKVTESLSTTYKLSRRVDEYMNQFRYRAKVGNGWIYDVFLTVRP